MSYVAAPARVALVGNPNSGKTALFNALTGSRQKVANYPGVTVERKEGLAVTPAGVTVRLVDLPGTYSLRARSLDEIVTRDIVLGRLENDEIPRLLVCVADSTNLRLALRLALELKCVGRPIIFALNMFDIARHRGFEIDLDRLSAELGIPVVASVAVRRGGTKDLLARIDEVIRERGLPRAPEWSEPDAAQLRATQREADRILDAAVKIPGQRAADRGRRRPGKPAGADRRGSRSVCRWRPISLLCSRASARLRPRSISPRCTQAEHSRSTFVSAAKSSPQLRDKFMKDGSACVPAARRDRARVVVIGAGFGGLKAARELAQAPVEVTVIDRHNYHLFQPLLYQVATAALSPADITQPIRAVLRRQRNAAVLLDEVTGIDTAERRIETRFGASRKYDFLVLATGSQYAYFGHGDWPKLAPGLKSIDDATLIRRRVLLAFEEAESVTDAAIRQRLLTFVLVGAGPTGVEMAGALAELAHATLSRDFRWINPHTARILLVEAGPRVLAGFPEKLAAFARRSLERMGVEVFLNTPIEAIDRAGVLAGGRRIEAANVIWCAGVEASPVARWLGLPRAKGGRVEVAADLSIPGHPEIFVIGDAAFVTSPGGDPLPGVAPVAEQEGNYVAEVISRQVRGEPAPPPFRYRDKGMLATIGRHSAIADFGRIRFTGWLAWVLWGIVHIFFLIGFRNRIAVFLNWIWAWLTYARGARLITGDTTPLALTTKPDNRTVSEATGSEAVPGARRAERGSARD